MIGSLFLAALAGAQAQPAERPPEAPIVVTGARLQDTEAALKACLQRKCPPNEDIDASLAHAENLFVAGDYNAARSVIKASLRRNGRHARAYPEPVADLNRASSRVASHLGHDEDAMRSTWEILRVLRAGIPEEDRRHLGARLEVAAMETRMRGPHFGKPLYRSIVRDARATGHGDIAALAELRMIWLDYVVNPRGARPALERFVLNEDPAARGSVIAARVMLARLDRQSGREEAVDMLIRELSALNSTQPSLIHAPPFELHQQDLPNVTEASDTFEDKWIDVGFWVTPDGKVSELEILRTGGSTDWSAPLLKSIAGRIYSRTDPAQGGVYRVERYTYTARWERLNTGTRMSRRSPAARVEYLDLTAEGDAR